MMDRNTEDQRINADSMKVSLIATQSSQQDIRNDYEQWNERQHDAEKQQKKREKILQWLTPVDHRISQLNAIKERNLVLEPSS